jgi:hypothetical protein
MCLKCDLKMASVRQLPSRDAPLAVPSAGDERASASAQRRFVDPVRAMRLRDLLERTVFVGLGPDLFPPGRNNWRILAAPDQGRGGAQAVFVRQVAIYLGHVGCRLSYSEVGSLYARNRTTAARACSIIEDRRDDPRLDQTLALLELCIRAEFRRIEPRWAEGPLSQAPRPAIAARKFADAPNTSRSS